MMYVRIVLTLGCFWEDTDNERLPDSKVAFHQNINSTTECQNLCQKLNDCAYFTIRQKGNSSDGCYLSTDSISHYYSNGSTSGPKYCNGG